jgi:TonB family protein
MSQRNVTRWLIHHAARHAPDSVAERLEEEWLADLEARPSGLSRLRFTIGCCWATQVIAFEHQPARAAVSSSAVAGQGLIAYADKNFGFISLRSSTFFLVVGLHIVLIYGFMTALSHTHKSAMPDPLQNRDLPASPPRELPPPLPSPALMPWTIDVPKPLVVVPPEPGTDVTANIVEQSPEPNLPPQLTETQTQVAKQVAGGPGAGFPDTADFYPSLSIHLGEQGISTVRVCVDAKGRLTSDPTTVKGSGSTRLDEGALKLAQAGSGHYRAATEDGQPVNSCYPLGIRFQLKN